MTCEACRTLPPVIPEGYTAKGQYKDIAGFKTCMFGSLEMIELGAAANTILWQMSPEPPRLRSVSSEYTTFLAPPSRRYREPICWPAD